MNLSRAELDAGTIVLPKRISLAIAVGFAAQLVFVVYHFAINQGTTSGEIERLKRDVAVVGLINERTIRIEEQLAAIRSSVERQSARH
jgi:hypothetical protein